MNMPKPVYLLPALVLSLAAATTFAATSAPAGGIARSNVAAPGTATRPAATGTSSDAGRHDNAGGRLRR
jgi:hypothetical protein